jgi:hypothetical protein
MLLRDYLEDLLIEELPLEFIFVYDTVEHNEFLPELDGSEYKLRVNVTNGIHQDLQIEPPVLVGREKEMWVPHENQGEAPYDWETHLV